jgi:hypothetical protein
MGAKVSPFTRATFIDDEPMSIPRKFMFWRVKMLYGVKEANLAESTKNQPQSKS